MLTMLSISAIVQATNAGSLPAQAGLMAFVYAGSSNGRTSPSGGEYLGSSPSPAAKHNLDLNTSCWGLSCCSVPG